MHDSQINNINNKRSCELIPVGIVLSREMGFLKKCIRSLSQSLRSNLAYAFCSEFSLDGEKLSNIGSRAQAAYCENKYIYI